MTDITSRNAARQDFMPLMRELVRAYQAFAAYDAQLYRTAGSVLTTSQADVIFTLGNTEGMSCSEIGEKTLITKGTLTGILDRLEARGLIERQRHPEDGRSFRIVLTVAGKAVFEKEFPRQIRALKQRFDLIPEADRRAATRLLRTVRAAFE